MPPGPPWKLVSPNGVLHIILDLLAVSQFCKEEGLSTFDIKHLLEIEEGNTERPMHVKFWQPLHLLLFLRHKDGSELVPVLGGPGKGRRVGEAGVDYFIEAVAKFRSDMSFTANHRAKLQRLLVESYTSHGKPSNDYQGWGLAAAPANLEAFFPRVVQWSTVRTPAAARSKGPEKNSRKLSQL